MRLEGAKQLQIRLKKFSEGHARAMETVLRLGGLLIMGESQKHTPIDTSLLRNSHRVVVKGTGIDTTVFVTCATAYAIYVHEDLNARHAPGTWAKFLEKAARAKSKELKQIANKVFKDVR